MQTCVFMLLSGSEILKMNFEFNKFNDEDRLFLFERFASDKNIILNEPVQFNSLGQFSDFFNDRLNRVYHDFFIVSNEKGKIGYVYSFDYRVYDLNCKLFLSADRCHKDIIKSVACKLFEEYPLEKIFLWIRQDDSKTREAAEMISTEPEAILCEYIYADGQFLNVFVYGISRKDVIDE